MLGNRMWTYIDNNFTRNSVIFFIFLYGLEFSFLLLFLMAGPWGPTIAEFSPGVYMLYLVRGIGGFILLGSCIGVLFRKAIAYYATYIGFLFIGLSGMTKNIVLELEGMSITWGADVLVYVVVPIGIMIYLFYDLKKIRMKVQMK